MKHHPKQDPKDPSDPWLHPQFLYIDDRVEVYAYESPNDWERLLGVFNISSQVLKELNISRHNVAISIEDKIKEVYALDVALYKKRALRSDAGRFTKTEGE